MQGSFLPFLCNTVTFVPVGFDAHPLPLALHSLHMYHSTIRLYILLFLSVVTLQVLSAEILRRANSLCSLLATSGESGKNDNPVTKMLCTPFRVTRGWKEIKQMIQFEYGVFSSQYQRKLKKKLKRKYDARKIWSNVQKPLTTRFQEIYTEMSPSAVPTPT